MDRNRFCIEQRWQAIQLANQLLSLADELVTDCDRSDCLMLGSIIRDCAYLIRSKAELPFSGLPMKGEKCKTEPQ